MQYMLLIYGEESREDAMTPEQMGELMGAYGSFHEEVAASGKLIAADRLRPVADATTVRVRDGKLATTDGPFAETKEQLGGYYVLDVADIDEAIAWARKVPSAAYGSVELRPIWQMEEQ